MPGSVLIRNGFVATPRRTRDEILQPCDVLIRDGKIAQVAPRIECEGVEQVDATGCWVLPGAIDLHVHFRDPHPNPAEDLYTGSLAAAAGGVTAFADMPNTSPITTPGARLEDKLALAAEKACVDYAFYVTNDPAKPQFLDALDATATPGLKVFLGGTTAAEAVDDQQMAIMFNAARRAGVPVTVHAEEDGVIEENIRRLAQQGIYRVFGPHPEGGISPDDVPHYHMLARDYLACVTSTCRAIRAARRHGVHLHIAHVTTGAEVELIRAAKAHGDQITAETTLHHLCFSQKDYEQLRHELKCNPSVKTQHDADMIWEGLWDGTIDMIGTDHAPHSPESKKDVWSRAPSGVASAVEYLLPAIITEGWRRRTTGSREAPTRDALADLMQRIVNWTCVAPIAFFGIEGKGALDVGADGDVVVVDLTPWRRTMIYSQRNASPWAGQELRGFPQATYLRGELIHSRERPIRCRGKGRALRFTAKRRDPRPQPTDFARNPTPE